MSYTTFSGTGDNLPRINDWRSLHQKLPRNLQLTSTIMMTSLSSAISQASQQNAARVKQNLERYDQEFPKLMAHSRSNRAVADIIPVFNEMSNRARQVSGMHMTRTADEQAKYNVGVKGAQRSLTQQDLSEESEKQIDASVQRAADRVALSVPAQGNTKMIVIALLAIAAIGGLAYFFKNK